MWEFIKSIFRKEEPLPKEEIELSRLPEWFDEKTKTTVLEMNNSLAESRQKITKEILEARNNLALLAEAKLLNPNIPERAKHFMEGNREAFSKRITQFIDRVDFPYKIEEYDAFHLQMQEELKDLMKQTARPFQILQEFFAHESKQAMSNVGAIEKEINLIKQKSDAAGIGMLDEIKATIKELSAKIKLRQEQENVIKEKEEKIAEMSKIIAVLEGDIILLQKDRQLEQLKQHKKETDKEVEEIRTRITGPFSAIDTALRKFERITYRHREIAQEYIQSPLDALMKDLHLGILKVLADMQLAILNNRIDLKDRKKDRTLEVMQLLTKEYLGSFLTEYGQLRKKQSDLKKQLEEMEVVVVLRKKKSDLDAITEEKEKTQAEIKELKKELESLNIEGIISELAENFRKTAKTHVAIKLEKDKNNT